MSDEFKVGDHVYLNDDGMPENDSGYATIEEIFEPEGEAYLSFEDFQPFNKITYPLYRLTFMGRESEPAQPEYVHVIESRQIWVTLPGDTAGHKLSEDEARTLFHQLEAIL